LWATSVRWHERRGPASGVAECSRRSVDLEVVDSPSAVASAEVVSATRVSVSAGSAPVGVSQVTVSGGQRSVDVEVVAASVGWSVCVPSV
jgi:hypothetical protein